MTNPEFQSWRERHFRSRRAAAIALGIDQEAVAAYERGTTRKGNPAPVPQSVVLACAAWTMNVRGFDGEAIQFG